MTRRADNKGDSSMTTRTTLIGLSAAAALAVGIGTYAFAQSSEHGSAFMHNRGAGMMQGMGPGMMGMGHDSDTMAELRVIHELFVNHDQIARAVTNLPDGIRTVTESEDPWIAQLLKDHVASMRQRVDAGNDPGLPIESDALHAIFQNYDKIETNVETTEKGVVVVQTSTDPETVAVLQRHASEVTNFVTDGMAAMRTAMMRNGGGMMQHRMHSGTIRSVPSGGTAPDGR
jgi:hypothetical protein